MDSRIIISRDSFNSEVFKLEFGNVSDFAFDITTKEIREALRETAYEIYGVRIDSKNLGAMYNFQKAGFYVVDCLVTYEFDKNKCILPETMPSLSFKDNLSEEEIENLANIARSVFKFDRFHSDPNIDKALADDYYYNWVKNSFHGFADGAVVPLVDEEVAGFTTYKINNVDSVTSTLVLSAVGSKYMGKGVYQNMILKGTIELLKHSTKIRLGTQVDNVPVQRTWQKLGYKLAEVKYILHYYKDTH